MGNWEEQVRLFVQQYFPNTGLQLKGGVVGKSSMPVTILSVAVLVAVIAIAFGLKLGQIIPIILVLIIGWVGFSYWYHCSIELTKKNPIAATVDFIDLLDLLKSWKKGLSAPPPDRPGIPSPNQPELPIPSSDAKKPDESTEIAKPK